MTAQNELLTWLACPDCGKKLSSLTQCDYCGACFPDSGGTPVLIPSGAHRTVTFNFPQYRSTVGEEFQRCFSYPPRSGACAADKPYHLDKAHLDVLTQLSPGSPVLEIGCGGGQMRSFIEAQHCRYVGVDISKTRVHEHLRIHGGPDLLCDSHFLPFTDRSFDLVYSVAVTEHLACPQLVAQEIARVLKPGGYYLGNVSFLEPWHDNSFFHMSPLGVFEILSLAEFEVIHIWPGQGYNGFRALLSMGNKATRAFSFMGDLINLIYKAGNRIRAIVGRDGNKTSNNEIFDAARVSGAVDWIARRPVK